MTAMRGSTMGGAALVLAGLGTSCAAQGPQLAFAAGVIATIGLPHGASDLALVPRRRASFLLAYLATVGLVAALWLAAPMVGLLSLLTLSALHFALDRPPTDGAAARLAIGGLLVAGPALGHREALARVFMALLEQPGPANALAQSLHLLAWAAAALVAWQLALRRLPRDAETFAGLGAVIALPPLIGFTVGFILLHAWPQLRERQRALGCPSLRAYLRRTAPVLAGATLTLAAIAWPFLRLPSAGVTLLFAAIAALATPHMLVTPLWRARCASAMPACTAPGR